MSNAATIGFTEAVSNLSDELVYISPLADIEFTQLLYLNRIAWYADCDGSLGVYQPGEHDDVPHDAELEGHIQNLVDLDGSFSIVTGRPQIFIERILPNIVTQIPVATEHGVLVCCDGEINDMIDDAVNMSEVQARLKPVLEGVPGCIVEDHKTRSITALCTELEDPASFSQVVHILTEEAGRLNQDAPRVTVKESTIPGNIVADLINTGADKNKACQFISERDEFKGKVPVCIIDSSGDKSMAEWVHANGGYVIIVGEYQGVECDFRVRTTDEFRDVLGRSAEIMQPRLSA